MKKIIAIVLSTILMLTLSVSALANTEADAVNEVYASITRESLGANPFDAVVYDDLTLPATDAKYNSVITWSSSNDAVITSSGEVTRGNDTKSVNLTANITVGEARKTKVFSFRVPGIYDDNYNGLAMINEEFTGSTLSAKVENQSGSTLSQSGGYLNISNTGASRTNIYLKENKSGITEHAALEFSIERTNKENEFTVFFMNQDAKTISRITIFGESTNYGSVYLRHYENGSEKLVNSVSSSELGSSSKYNVRLETYPQNNFGRVWINGVHIGDINMRSSADIAYLQVFKTAISGEIEEGSTHSLKIDNLTVSYLADNYRSAKAIYMDEFDNDITSVEGMTEEKGVITPSKNNTYVIPMGNNTSDNEVVVEFDCIRKSSSGTADQFGRIYLSDSTNSNANIFNIMWYDGSSTFTRLYTGTSEANFSSSAKYTALTPSKYNIDGDSMSVKAVINNTAKTFKIYINGIQVEEKGYSEFKFQSEAASGADCVRFQGNGSMHVYSIGAIRYYVPGTQTKPLAETTTLDYNAFDKKLNIRSSLDQTGKIFVASYLRDELISLSPVSDSDITLKANEDTQVSVKANIDGSADEIKIFLWSSETDSITPISKNISTSRISAN